MEPDDAVELRRLEEKTLALAKEIKNLRARVEGIPEDGSLPRITPSMSLADRLRTIRGWRELTQTTLAGKAGLNKNTIINVENGSGVREKTLHRLAEALDVPVSVLRNGRWHV